MTTPEERDRAARLSHTPPGEEGPKRLLEEGSLWIMIAAPCVWALHFLLAYWAAAVWCAKVPARTGDILVVRLGVGGLTIVALAVVGWLAWKAVRSYRATAPDPGEPDRAQRGRANPFPRPRHAPPLLAERGRHRLRRDAGAGLRLVLLTAPLLGSALLALLWLGPLADLAAVSMTAHMLLHVGVAAAAPALLRIRLPLTLGAPALAAIALADLAVVWGWHLPAAHLWASLSDTGFVLQQAMFLAAGIAVWSAADAAGRLGGAAVLLATAMHMTLLGVLLTLAPVVLYPGVCGGGPFGLEPLEDQQVAGVVMALLPPTIYLWGGLARLAPLVREGSAS